MRCGEDLTRESVSMVVGLLTGGSVVQKTGSMRCGEDLPSPRADSASDIRFSERYTNRLQTTQHIASACLDRSFGVGNASKPSNWNVWKQGGAEYFEVCRIRAGTL